MPGKIRANRGLFSFLGAVLLAGCAVLGAKQYEGRFGAADPARFDMPHSGPELISYRQEIQPILDRRCVVCHACYDAPCQLKLTSWEGVARGASKEVVYDVGRLEQASPTRLYVDAERASEWRRRDFFPVLNERTASAENDLAASLLHRMIALKEKHPLSDRQAYQQLDFSLDRKQTCAADHEMDRFEEKNPLSGMPFGLPGLSQAESTRINTWLQQGAPGDAAEKLSPALQQQIDKWERFFNGDSAKERLVARYIYEHLFLAHLHFDEVGGRPQYFRLVRSATPPGSELRLIRSRRPVDAPGVDRVYYRFVAERESIVDKTHMPYALNAKRMARWQALFLKPDYQVRSLPGYDRENTANPFQTFHQLPINSRYRFMLDEAEFTVMNFIKGPVCRGQVALNVIDDQFWVFFAPPSESYEAALEELMTEGGDLLRLPTGSSGTGIFLPWIRYAELEEKYLQTKSKYMLKALAKPENLSLERIWDGDGRNPNAALTIFRHFDSATVVKGLVGDPPKTAWVIGYTMLERIHYLLVANYDVYGNLGHQLNSRLYMDYLRMEGEFNFLVLLPEALRMQVRDDWYRGTPARVRKQVYGDPAVLPLESGIRYETADPKRELFAKISQRLSPVLDRRHDLTRVADPAVRNDLQQLATLRGANLQLMPELSILALRTPGGAVEYYSLIRNTGHSTVSHMLMEGKTLLPDEDTLTVTKGIVGSYPNAFYQLEARDLPDFTRAVAGLSSEADYTRLADRYAMRRSNPAFWSFSDTLQDAISARGILDYNRLENR